MKDTRHLSNTELVPNRVEGYKWVDGRFRHASVMNPVVETSNGGLMSTVLDLAKWDAALVSGRILRPETRREMWSPVKLANGTVVPSYGLGFGLTPFRGKARIGHTGKIPGFASAYTHIVPERVTVIVLMNADQEDEGASLAGEMANEIASYYFRE
jgi:CubicO group peptidase (beta-lactamase class C family)